MSKIKREIMGDAMHKDSNMFVLLIICHGDDKENLQDRDKNVAWNTDELALELSGVESLKKRPKLLIIQACRGSEY